MKCGLKINSVCVGTEHCCCDQHQQHHTFRTTLILLHTGPDCPRQGTDGNVDFFLIES